MGGVLHFFYKFLLFLLFNGYNIRMVFRMLFLENILNAAYVVTLLMLLLKYAALRCKYVSFFIYFIHLHFIRKIVLFFYIKCIFCNKTEEGRRKEFPLQNKEKSSKSSYFMKNEASKPNLKKD